MMVVVKGKADVRVTRGGDDESMHQNWTLSRTATTVAESSSSLSTSFLATSTNTAVFNEITSVPD